MLFKRRERFWRLRWLEVRFGYQQFAAVLQSINFALIAGLYFHIGPEQYLTLSAMCVSIVSAFLIVGFVYRRFQLTVDNKEGNQYLLDAIREIVKEELHNHDP